MSEFEIICQKLKERLASADDLVIDTSEYQQAAVTLMLRNRDGDADIFIIKRAERAEDPWSGHLALPGGRADDGDPDLRAVAVRETREEVGIDLDAGGEFLGVMEPLQPVTRRLPLIVVTPLVAVAPTHIALQLDRNEVDDAFWLPVSEMKRNGRSDSVQFVFAGQTRQWPAYPSPRGAIWGMTERILTRFLALLD
jgi:8-oxo-dGTP pyrophosphatase MutT (NUDIX family)